MEKCSDSRRKSKPAKPYEAFPLFAHETGRWAKKVRGKMRYFGPWADPDAALLKWQEQEHDLRAGRTPRVRRDGLTIGDPPDAEKPDGLVNRFLTAKRHLLDTREITQRTFQDYMATCTRLVAVFGWSRLVDDLDANDFERLRKDIAKTRGAVALANEIGRVRVVFKFATDNTLVPSPIPYGQGFRKPSRKALRKVRAERGVRVFEASEIRQMLDKAAQPLKAMILLGINAGLGQSDISGLPRSALNLETGWMAYPRPKTGIERRCFLWPETVKSLHAVLADRPRNNDPDDDGLVFITKYGARWSRTNAKGTSICAISQEFRKLSKALSLDGQRGFYCLRHGFETIGGEARDQVAVNHVMGHIDESMAGVYRESISDERLMNVANYVRAWLFPKSTKQKATKRKAKPQVAAAE